MRNIARPYPRCTGFTFLVPGTPNADRKRPIAPVQEDSMCGVRRGRCLEQRCLGKAESIGPTLGVVQIKHGRITWSGLEVEPVRIEQIRNFASSATLPCFTLAIP